VPTDSHLIRAIGVRRLAASIVNVTIGAGIFVLPAVAARGLGRAAPVAYIACAVAMALIVTCFAAAGSRIARTGGPYAYTQVAFGPFIGFISGVLLWLSCTVAAASVAAALADSASVAVPALAAGVARGTFLIVLFSSLAFVNVRGVTAGARLIEVTTFAKLLPLLLLIAAGIWFGSPAPQGAPIPVPSVDDVGRTALVVIFAFLGIELALVPSGEVRQPARTVPRATFLALAVTTAIYLLVQMVVQAALGDRMADFAAAPLAEAGAQLLGGWGRAVILAGATISMFGYVSGDMLGTPRLLFAFARDGIFPAAFAAVHPRFRTPWIAIVVHAFLAAALAVSSSFASLALLTNLATLSMYLLCVAASFELQRRNVEAGGTPFSLPGGPIVPALAACVILWLLWHATGREFAVQAIVLTAASLFYFLRRTIHPWPTRTLQARSSDNS
jgi:amino acid transporter